MGATLRDNWELVSGEAYVAKRVLKRIESINSKPPVDKFQK